MPFFVATSRGKRAALSLAAAHKLARRAVDRQEPFGGAPYGPWADAREQVSALPATGGSVTLPNAQTVTLNPVGWTALIAAVDGRGPSHDPSVWQREVISRWNDRFGVGSEVL